MNKKIGKPKGKTWGVLKVLLKGHWETTMDLIHQANVTRPPNYISELKNKWDVPIKTRMVYVTNPNGDHVSYARYRMPPSLLQEQRKRFGL